MNKRKLGRSLYLSALGGVLFVAALQGPPPPTEARVAPTRRHHARFVVHERKPVRALTAVRPLGAAERIILEEESAFRTDARSTESSAFGLGQLIRANRDHYARLLGVAPDTTDWAQQVALFRAYVADRYRTAEAALAFRRIHGWY